MWVPVIEHSSFRLSVYPLIHLAGPGALLLCSELCGFCWANSVHRACWLSPHFRDWLLIPLSLFPSSLPTSSPPLLSWQIILLALLFHTICIFWPNSILFSQLLSVSPPTHANDRKWELCAVLAWITHSEIVFQHPCWWPCTIFYPAFVETNATVFWKIFIAPEWSHGRYTPLLLMLSSLFRNVTA